jgi:hypothetical protein
MFLSKRLVEFKFQVRESTTTALPSVFNNMALIVDKALKLPSSVAQPFKNPEVAPENGYT